MVDGPQVINWAAQGLLTPLDKYFSTSKITSSVFWTPSWKQVLWKGHSYAVPMLSDPNYPLIYNKKAFAEAGLGGPPTTMAQLDTYTQKLNKKNSASRFTRLGFMPWWHCGMTNMLFTFGWIFGGDFYNEHSSKVTCTDPKVVKALEWFRDFAQLYNIAELDRMTANFGSNPIVAEKVAMMPHTSDFLIEARSRKFQYGWGYMPTAPGGPEKSVWGRLKK